MLWFRVPPKVYQKFGCLSLAMQELKECKRAFLVTDAPLVSLGYHAKVTAELDKMNIAWEMFSDVEADPTLAVVKIGAEAMRRFQPDVVIALGGGSPMDAAKTMKVMYEDPDVSFEGMAQRFMDIEKRTYKFPEGKKKAQMVCIPTTSGTGSEVTPFAVVTDEKTGTKYPLADYYLTPDMAIVDAELVLTMPAGLTAASGIDAVTHALEAIASVMDSDYTRGLALESLRNLFTYLPVSYAKGSADKVAREKVHNAATMAGMAFSNAFLGICHSMAHKLGAAFHIPHGVANALLINQVIRFNAVENPAKIAAFSQYGQPEAIQRYAQVADYLGLKGKTEMDKVESLCDSIDALAKELNIPSTIAEAGVREADFLAEVDNLAELAFDDQCTGANPRYPLIKELRQMYLNAYYGQK